MNVFFSRQQVLACVVEYALKIFLRRMMRQRGEAGGHSFFITLAVFLGVGVRGRIIYQMPRAPTTMDTSLCPRTYGPVRYTVITNKPLTFSTLNG